MVVGGTNSDDDFYKIDEKLDKRLRKITDSAREMSIDLRVTENDFSHWFSRYFDMAITPMKIKGESVLGTCEACIDFFINSEKGNLKKLLDRFDSSWDNSLERTWRNKTPIRKLLSKIFTKDNSNHFRNSLE